MEAEKVPETLGYYSKITPHFTFYRFILLYFSAQESAVWARSEHTLKELVSSNWLHIVCFQHHIKLIAWNQFLRCAPRLRCRVERSSVWTLLRSVNNKDQNKRPVFTDSAHASSIQVWTFVSAMLHGGWSSSFTRYPYCDDMLRMYYITCTDVYILRDVTVKLATPCATVLFRTTF
jgi:hypothetical protein